MAGEWYPSTTWPPPRKLITCSHIHYKLITQWILSVPIKVGLVCIEKKGGQILTLVSTSSVFVKSPGVSMKVMLRVLGALIVM